MRVWRLGKRLLKGPPSNPIGKLGVLGVKPKRLIKGISMKMSSCRWGLEGGPVAQHRPQDVDPPSRQRDQGLWVCFLPSALLRS
jgi:hypothetical protein